MLLEYNIRTNTREISPSLFNLVWASGCLKLYSVPF